MKKVAVLIPSYQPKEYIDRCLSSLENQTLSKEKYCIYIALNGQKDPYEKYIKSIIEKMNSTCRYLYIKEAGVSNARNRLLDYSTEDYVVFVDDDDVVSENYLENLLEISSESYMGISNIVNFRREINDFTENYIGKLFINLSDVEVSKFKIRKYFSSPWAKIIHRKMIKDYKFDIKLKNGEDGLFMAMISKNILGTCKTSKDTYYYVFERAESASRIKRSLSDRFTAFSYLSKKYTRLLITTGYDKVFILTRLAATLRYVLKR